MKRSTFFIIGAMLVILCIACEKKASEPSPTPFVSAATLAGSESFVLFAKGFILNFKELTDYYRSGKPVDKTVFINRLKEAGDDETQVREVYAAYGLSFDEAMIRKNRVDNSLLQLFLQHKELLAYSETETWKIISDAISFGFASGKESWQALRNVTAPATMTMLSAGTHGLVVKAPTPGLDLNEVWICLKEAVGFGGASVMGIGGLQKLVQKGFQQAVVSVSKWLAKRAGWVGAAIMVFDFSMCIYREAND